MSWNAFLCHFDPVCIKHYHNRSEFRKVRKHTTLVNSTDLYALYDRLFGNMTYQEFYAEARKHFYFEKYVCVHGTEYYYYIKTDFNISSKMPTDIIKVIKAGGYND